MNLISSVGVRPVLEHLVPQFEKETGVHIAIAFGTAVQMKAKADSGDAFDLVILNPPQIDDLIAHGKADGATRTDLARSGMGFAVAAGIPLPDLSSDEKMKAWLLGLKTIATGNPASGGFGSVYFDKMVQRLGIAGHTRALTIHQPPGEFAKPVAAGKADMGAGLISEMIGMANVQCLPVRTDDAGAFVGFAAALSLNAAARKEALAFLQYLRTPAAAEVFRSRGLTPAP